MYIQGETLINLSYLICKTDSAKDLIVPGFNDHVKHCTLKLAMSVSFGEIWESTLARDSCLFLYVSLTVSFDYRQ